MSLYFTVTVNQVFYRIVKKAQKEVGMHMQNNNAVEACNALAMACLEHIIAMAD